MQKKYQLLVAETKKISTTKFTRVDYLTVYIQSVRLLRWCKGADTSGSWRVTIDFLIASCGSWSHIIRSAVSSAPGYSSVVGSDGWICPASSPKHGNQVHLNPGCWEAMRRCRWNLDSQLCSLEINALKSKSRAKLSQYFTKLVLFVAHFLLNNPWNFHVKTLRSFEDIEDFVVGSFFSPHTVDMWYWHVILMCDTDMWY